MKVNLSVEVFASKSGLRSDVVGSKPIFRRELYQVEADEVNLPALCATCRTLFTGTNPIVRLSMEV